MKLFGSENVSNTKSVGLDIGSYSVKLIELSQNKDSISITNLSYALVKEPSSRSSLIDAIKSCAASSSINTREFNIAISGPAVIVRFIELPNMSASELGKAISFEAEKYIPFSINEVLIDHSVIIPNLGNNKMLVLLVAAKKAHIEERLKLLEDADLNAALLDVVSVANANAFLINPRKKGVSAVIDLGAKATDIDIIDNNVLYFSRSIQMGGEDITKSLSNKLSIDPVNAEELKINPAKRSYEVFEAVKPILYNIIDEIRPSLSYYENQSGKNIERVYMTGGGSRMLNIYSLMKENLELNIEPWDPTEDMQICDNIDKKLHATVKDLLGVATGLALR